MRALLSASTMLLIVWAAASTLSYAVIADAVVPDAASMHLDMAGLL